MSEILDRRARKKARTRAEIRSVARRLFAARGFDAVTIADIANEADVAVQTVFNHFATKEELFFDGRTPWVEGPAEAVRSRPAGASPLRALREYLTEAVSAQAAAYATAEHRNVIATLAAAPSLCTYELELVNRAEQLLVEALTEAWTQDGGTAEQPAPSDPATAARLVAASWLAICRALLLSRRAALHEAGEAGDAADCPTEIAAVAARMLLQFEQGTDMLETALTGSTRSVTGWPLEARRAG